MLSELLKQFCLIKKFHIGQYRGNVKGSCVPSMHCSIIKLQGYSYRSCFVSNVELYNLLKLSHICVSEGAIALKIKDSIVLS